MPAHTVAHIGCHRLPRLAAALLIALLGRSTQASAQTCTTGLCTQQVVCPNGGTTSISGTVYAPNGTDPLPNVIVYIPNAAVAAFTPGVSCPVVGQPPSGSPIVGTTTAVDGSFTLTNVPVTSNIPLVIQSGRWRRQVVVPGTTACANTAFSTRMPKNQGEGDIPKIAVATGSADQVECVLRKVGIDDAEFTDPSGPGRINFYLGSGSAGATIDATTPSETALMGTASTLNSYDVLMLPCEGGQYIKPAAELANLIQFANAGGRVYSSHFSYVWMYQNPPFNSVVNWVPNQAQLPDGTATVDITFSEGQTLAQWLQLIGATTTQGLMPISTLRHDMDGVVAPTQSWLTLNDPADNNPVMQFVFNAPVGAAANQCGRVLFNEYHVENPPTSPAGKDFPAECSSAAMTPQEKLLEYSLFELTSDGGQPSLTPTSQDFGSEPVGFTTAPQSFVWTNNSTFPASASPIASGDFSVTSNNCVSVSAGASCQINVVFTPTAIGARTGTLTVSSSGSTLLASLTGTGIADLTFSSSTLTFGNVDVGASSTKTLNVMNNASGSISVPPFLTTGDYATTTTCGSTLAALSTCTINVIFTPTTTGPRSGTLTVNSTNPAFAGVAVALSGNGVDFSITVAPTSAGVIAGYGVSPNVIVSPIAGFAANVSLSCTTMTVASICTPATTSFLPAATPIVVAITTTSKYTVIGYGGVGGNALLSLLAFGCGWLLWRRRRSERTLLQAGLIVFLLGAISLWTTGCSGKLPDLNPSYTAPGTYTYTMTATDGTLTHSATYTLTVTSQ